jgi:hypothetical protein
MKIPYIYKDEECKMECFFDNREAFTEYIVRTLIYDVLDNREKYFLFEKTSKRGLLEVKKIIVNVLNNFDVVKTHESLLKLGIEKNDFTNHKTLKDQSLLEIVKNRTNKLKEILRKELFGFEKNSVFVDKIAFEKIKKIKYEQEDDKTIAIVNKETNERVVIKII